MTMKQEIHAIINFMNDEDVLFALELLKDNFSSRRKSSGWDNIEEINATEDDFLLIEKINNKTDGYGEYITQSELIENLELNK
ncbi:MAG: hypothetical protein FWC95_01545 [Defluviitaleaceae bacterium]|nr:hypothetical protein [Defluviitaleaceae bacterium]